jgi:hypothetical protein
MQQTKSNNTFFLSNSILQKIKKSPQNMEKVGFGIMFTTLGVMIAALALQPFLCLAIMVPGFIAFFKGCAIVAEASRQQGEVLKVGTTYCIF